MVFDKIGKYSGQKIMDFANDVIEPVSRKLLSLPAEPPEISGFVFQESSYHPRWGQLYTMEEVSEEKRQAEIERWHAEGRKGELADKLTRRVHNFGYALKYNDFLLVERYEEYRFWRELEQARNLRWVPYHYARRGESTHIDGFLELPSGRQMTLDISCIGDDRYWAEEAWRSGMGYEQATAPVEQAVLPTEVLTPALLEVALRGWYVGKFYYKPGHWSNREHKLPNLTIDHHWETECDDQSKQKQLNAKATEAETLMRELLTNEEASRLYQHYQTDAVPIKLT